MARHTGQPQRTPLPLTASLTIDPERLQRMRSMRPADRHAAARRGEFSLGEMLEWAASEPSTVQTVHGEFWFIAENLADHEPADTPAARHGATEVPGARTGAGND